MTKRSLSNESVDLKKMKAIMHKWNNGRSLMRAWI